MNTHKIILISQIHEYITIYVISYIIYNAILMGDGLVQDCGNFIDIELPQYCHKQSIYTVRNNQYSL